MYIGKIFNYAIVSLSIQIKSKAIPRAGNIKPTKGTSIEGK